MAEPLTSTNLVHVLMLACDIEGRRFWQLSAVRLRFGPALVGTARIVQLDESRALLRNVFVTPGLRGQGVATEMLRVVQRWGDTHNTDVFLTVPPSSPARRLYEAEGFELTGNTTETGSLEMVRFCHEFRLARKEDGHAD